jgi:PBP1b-binding outer membrane lipoprotein LpoB
MKKTMIVASALVVLLCFHGCSQSEMSEVNTKTVDPVETVDSAEEKARQIAIQKFNEIMRKPNGHLGWEITVQENENTWSVSFWRPENALNSPMVSVSKTTGEATYIYGE